MLTNSVAIESNKTQIANLPAIKAIQCYKLLIFNQLDMSMKFKKNDIKDLKVGHIINVSIAHRFRKEYGWDSYSDHKYKIENINPYSIRGRNIDYEHEIIVIERSDVDCGRFSFNSL